MFGRRHKFITHLGSLLHQKIWPAQSFHSFPPFMSYLRPRGVKFFLPLVDESCPIRVWLKKIHMMDRGPDSHNLGPKTFGTKSVESDRLHMGIAFLNLQGFKLQRGLGPLLIWSFPDAVKFSNFDLTTQHS